MKSTMEMVETPAKFISRLLEKLRPFPIDFRPGDPVAACRLLDKLDTSALNGEPSPPLGPFWPRPPRIIPSSYSLAQAQLPALLPVFDCGPVQRINAPGVNTENQQLPALALCQQVCGHVIAFNGEVAFERIDATIPGPLEFHWRRFYRYGNREDSGLGRGWRHSLSEQLHINDGEAELHTAEGRLIRFKIPAIGHSCFNRFERLLLHRQSLHSYRIIGFNQPQRVFRADGVNSALPLTEIRDQFGNALSIDYREGLPSKIVSSWGRVVEFHYRDGQIEKLINTQAPDSQRELCHYEYDSQMLTRANAGLNHELYEYREQRLFSVESNTRGRLMFYCDAQGRCRELQCNQLTHTLNWRPSERRCTLQVAGRHPLEWKFNRAGQLIEERQHDKHTRWLYDIYGNLCEEILPNGQRTIYRHDELGRLTRRTRNQICDRYLYDKQGFLVAVQWRGEQIWRFNFNERGCPLEITDPENHIWQCQYSERGQLVELKDPEGGLVRFNWDSQGQLQTIQRGDRCWGFEHDHWQRPTALIVDGETRRSWRYGEKGELCAAALGKHSFQLEYGEDNRPCAISDDSGQKLHWQCDSAGLCRQIRFADDRKWELHYDLHGQLLNLKTDAGNTAWNYDHFGRIASREDMDGRLRHWHYFPDGKVREYRDSDLRWYFRYADDGTLVQVRNNSGQHCEFRSDRHGRLVRADNGNASVDFQYDRRNRLVAEHHDNKDAAPLSLKHNYDARGWLTSSASDDLALSYTMAPSGDLYGVDANGEAVLRCEAGAESSVWIQGELHSRRNYQCGQPIELTAGELAWHFTAEPPLRLTEPEQLPPPTDGVKILRDRRGNIIREFRPDNRREYLYQYDGWGLLSGAECGDFKTWFRYDPFGRRLNKLSTHRKSTRQRRIDTRWYSLGLWCETRLLNGKPESPFHYIYHPVDRTLLGRWHEAAIEHYLVDPQGQILALFDHNGTPLWSDSGNAECKSNPGPWRGRSLLADSETGLWYCLQGYWHPLLQTWLNVTHDYKISD